MKVNKDNLGFHPMQESEVEHIFNLVNDAYRYLNIFKQIFEI